jgi:hypothetical protein
LLTFGAIELTNWLINAFNGEWLKTEHPKPVVFRDDKEKIRKMRRREG